MLGLAVHGLMYAAQPAIMTEMFPTRMRYSGVSLGYQVTALVAGSWAPLIGTALLRQWDSWVPIAWYVLASSRPRSSASRARNGTEAVLTIRRQPSQCFPPRR